VEALPRANSAQPGGRATPADRAGVDGLTLPRRLGGVNE
jgi:hypothetical protein